MHERLCRFLHHLKQAFFHKHFVQFCLIAMPLCRWHIEGEISHDWKKLAERKEKQLRKLSDIYKGQLDKVIKKSINLHFLSLGLSTDCCQGRCIAVKEHAAFDTPPACILRSSSFSSCCINLPFASTCDVRIDSLLLL